MRALFGVSSPSKDSTMTVGERPLCEALESHINVIAVELQWNRTLFLLLKKIGWV